VTTDLSGQVAVVTGGGNGLGRGCALQLAALGAAVVVNDLGGPVDGAVGSSAAVADTVVAEIRARGGTATASYETVATPEGGAAIVQAALDEFGRLDALAHYAAVVRHQPFDTMPFDDLEVVLDVSLRGAFHVSQPAFRAMKAAGYGRILLIGSAVGLLGIDQESSYAAAKAGTYGLTRALAVEGAGHGILANHLLPGGDTRLADANPNRGRARAADPSGDPERLAALPAFLLSPDCPTTGGTFAAMGGHLCRFLVGATPGWFVSPDDPAPSIEDVAERWDQITDEAGHVVLDGLRDLIRLRPPAG
jgi:NAD(P)-dependent dehydrogenase (short-subunit alcohol dehydrogenase family)